MANGNIINKIEQPVLTPKPEFLAGNRPEVKTEILTETVTENVIKKEGAVTSERISGSVPAANTPAVTDDYHLRREKEIDAYLSDGLSETFLAMSPEKQKIFKEEGEETAKKINILLDATKINISKIVKLIRHWLSLITGINRFFLDQEAKIKADKIIKIKNKL